MLSLRYIMNILRFNGLITSFCLYFLGEKVTLNGERENSFMTSTFGDQLVRLPPVT